MDEYEREFEDNKVALENQIQTQDHSISKLETKLRKVEEDKNGYKKDATESENQLEKL